MQVPDIDYNAKALFWKDQVEKETAKAKDWPGKWQELTTTYNRDCYETLQKGSHGLPHKRLKVVVKDDFVPFTPKPEDIRCFPDSSQRYYGWKVGNSPLMRTYGWTAPRALRYNYKALKWPEDHQW